MEALVGDAVDDPPLSGGPLGRRNTKTHSLIFELVLKINLAYKILNKRFEMIEEEAL